MITARVRFLHRDKHDFRNLCLSYKIWLVIFDGFSNCPSAHQVYFGIPHRLTCVIGVLVVASVRLLDVVAVGRIEHEEVLAGYDEEDVAEVVEVNERVVPKLRRKVVALQNLQEKATRKTYE